MPDNINKKVILLVPPFSEQAAMSAEEEFKQKTKELRVYPPLGLGYLAGELLSKGVDCEIIDSAALGINEEEIAKMVSGKEPAVIGITVTSFTLRSSASLIKKLKKIKPALPIVVGGPHITHWPESVFDLGADYGIRGDAERSLFNLVKYIFRGEPSLDGIEGLVFKKKNGEPVNNGTAVIRDLNGLAFPSRKLLCEEKYVFAMSNYRKFTTMITTRGCLFDCVYCGLPHKEQFHARSIDNVINELRVIADGAYGYVNFVDDCFTVDRDRVMKICNKILKDKLKISWGCATRADYVDYELLKTMKEAGCYDIRFGVESGVERIRQSSIGKKISNRTFVKSFRCAKKAGLVTTGFFLFGHPGETVQNMRQTVSFAKKLNTHYAVFMLATPVPGSRLFDIALKEGKLSRDIWKKISVNQAPVPVYTPDSVTLKQMKTLQNQAALSFYLSINSIMLKFKEIRSPGELLFKLRLGFILLSRSILKYLKYSGKQKDFHCLDIEKK